MRRVAHRRFARLIRGWNVADQLHESVVRAIVHLNFNEPEQALALLLGALSDSNFDAQEKANGNAAAAN